MILNKNPCPTNTKKKKKPEATIFTIFMFLNFRITQVLVLLKIKNFLWFAYQKLAVMLADYEQAFMEQEQILCSISIYLLSYRKPKEPHSKCETQRRNIFD